MSSARVMLCFQTDNPRHMKAYSAIMKIPPGARSSYAVEMINRGVDIDECVYAAVTRALKDYQPQLNNKSTNSEAGPIPQDMLDFAFSL